MILRIIDRINKIREIEDLNKSQFERKINKSTGYINMLEKKNGQPGVDVILSIIKAFPDYNLNWIMTGEGEMKNLENPKEQIAEETATTYNPKNSSLILAMRDDLKNDLNEIAKGMATNFETLNEGVLRTLQGQQEILHFINSINAEEISKGAKGLSKFLEEHK